MKTRPTQFDARENTASSRQHAPRLARNASVLQSHPLSATEKQEKSTQELLPPTKETFELSLIEPGKGATGRGDSGRASEAGSDRSDTVQHLEDQKAAAGFEDRLRLAFHNVRRHLGVELQDDPVQIASKITAALKLRP